MARRFCRCLAPTRRSSLSLTRLRRQRRRRSMENLLLSRERLPKLRRASRRTRFTIARSRMKTRNENRGNTNQRTFRNIRLLLVVHFAEHAAVLRSAFPARALRAWRVGCFGALFCSVAGDAFAAQGSHVLYLWFLDHVQLRDHLLRRATN